MCVCVGLVFLGGEEEWQLSAGGSCRWKTPSFFPSFPGQRAAPMIRAEIVGEKALTQRNATLSDGGRPTITQHIFTAY